MPKIEVNKEWCKGCGICMVHCPKDILGFSNDLNKYGNHFCVQREAEFCTGCKFCGIMCPDGAIRVYK
jgi:2-oxoglutarate ferredoxin oxidoreductase subunit delta